MGGIPVKRHWVVVLRNGITAIDWGDGLFQDLESGAFFHGSEAQVSHKILDNELEQLKMIGCVYNFDSNTIYIHPLPELPHRTMD